MNINQLKKLDLQNGEDLKSFVSHWGSFLPGPLSCSNFIVELCYDEQSKEKTFISYLSVILILTRSIGTDTYKWGNGKFQKELINALVTLAKSMANKTFEFYNHMNSYVKSIISSNEFIDNDLVSLYVWSSFIEKQMKEKGVLFNSFDSLLEGESNKLKTKVKIYKGFIKQIIEN